VLVLAFVTALISGVFGMAGGLLLMGALGLVFSVSEAMALHGLMQAASNGSRAVVQRSHIQWRTVGLFAVGGAGAAALFALSTYAPSKAVLYLILGATPILAWIPKERLDVDASRPVQAVLCGALVTGLNIASGVSGPLLDVFFVRGQLGRHAVVATKAAVTVFAHAAKLAYYGAPLIAGSPETAQRIGVLFLASLPLTIAGAWVGSRLLDRFTDASFRRWTRLIVTALGALYLVRGVLLLAA
jgi:uncharacterized membrane protein YfcA